MSSRFSELDVSKTEFFFFFFFFFFIYLFIFLAVLGLRFCARASSSCGKRGPLLIAVRGPLTIAASPIAEHRLQTRRLSICGSRAQPLRGMRDPLRPGLEPVSPTLAGRPSTTAPPGKPLWGVFLATPHGLQDLSSQGWNPGPLQWKRGVVITGPPGNSLPVYFFR